MADGGEVLHERARHATDMAERHEGEAAKGGSDATRHLQLAEMARETAARHERLAAQLDGPGDEALL
jgi:hypothetical protein